MLTVIKFFSCLQIQKVVVALGDYMDAKCHACIGGTSVREDIIIFKEKGVHTVVGTPGRVFDMISRGSLGKYFLKYIWLHVVTLISQIAIEYSKTLPIRT